MKYSEIYSGPIIDLTHLAEEPIPEPAERNLNFSPLISGDFHNQRTKENNHEYVNSETES